MCGICGVVNREGVPVQEELVRRMAGTLAHRGPDGRGVFVNGPCGLGHTRLAVIDLSPAAAQPMANEDGSLHIVFNGEIYNYRALREQVAAQGHALHSHSDTEVILHLYEDEGLHGVERLRGMFAFALWDSPRQRLFLARDRVGKKPLYYYQDDRRFVFGSEIKALLAHPQVPRRLNTAALPYYLVHGYVPAPETMFAGVKQLLPGHVLIVESGSVRTVPYWHWPLGEMGETGERGELGEEGWAERVLDALRDAVRARLIADVPLGAFLSGGLDSSLIVALMSQLMDEPVKTFAIGFSGEPSFNELEYARQVAQRFATDHHEFVVQPDAVDLLPALVRHYDEPFADSSAIPTYLVARLTRQHVTVALTGDGGDELFAGYERFAAARLSANYRRLPGFLRRVVGGVVRRLPESTAYRGFARRARRFVDATDMPLAGRYLSWVGLFSGDMCRELLSSWGDSPADEVLADYQARFERAAERGLVNQLLYVNATTYLPGDLLVKTDRMTMAHALEARCPFLDQELIELVAAIPPALKLRGMTTKYILKRAAEKLLPREIVHRPKHGFGVPVGRWFRQELSDYVRDVLLSPRARQRGYFDPVVVARLIEEHQRGRRDWGHQLWTLLTFEMWHRIYLDADADPFTSP
ncbi:MAG: asparagine synthase (glutamine-hydrolyzing) [Anaerolineae bacterium]|nr:asparagine synthase (glutamine-hydrolyzing) [Anaerolineae bacterium]